MFHPPGHLERVAALEAQKKASLEAQKREEKENKEEDPRDPKGQDTSPLPLPWDEEENDLLIVPGDAESASVPENEGEENARPRRSARLAELRGGPRVSLYALKEEAQISPEGLKEKDEKEEEEEEKDLPPPPVNPPDHPKPAAQSRFGSVFGFLWGCASWVFSSFGFGSRNEVASKKRKKRETRTALEASERRPAVKRKLWSDGNVPRLLKRKASLLPAGCEGDRAEGRDVKRRVLSQTSVASLKSQIPSDVKSTSLAWLGDRGLWVYLDILALSSGLNTKYSGRVKKRTATQQALGGGRKEAESVEHAAGLSLLDQVESLCFLLERWMKQVKVTVEGRQWSLHGLMIQALAGTGRMSNE
uniref:Uncharacterized protein n=1 Tax=Chromera velia CCMP2878 TaxID=1169474 RepID=A0A0G4I1R2_9ALVE|eukprot:Cvel_34812.t1-p1 / transcript=Cvel_34812.t1 / gene=Cvel_34812 / organism=Chromera_velia_CCMP2878 / gene_product=hypothetical protein / transcript_product=hypothetical protein / location=Cvel_scaffold6108:62-2816(+) / protein_length=360 / sequence_SO=supercontig / SO=protein_coding / is_pseudo=false